MAQVADWRGSTSRHQNHKRSTCTEWRHAQAPEEENKAYHRLWACFCQGRLKPLWYERLRSHTAFGHGKLHEFGHSLSFDAGHSIIWEFAFNDLTQNFGIQRSEALFHILPASDPLAIHLFVKQGFNQPSSQSRNVSTRIGSSFFTMGTCWWSSFVFETLRQRTQNLLLQGFELCLPLFFFTLFFLCLFPGFRRSLGIFTKFAKLLELFGHAMPAASATVTGRVTGHRGRPSTLASLPVWAVLDHINDQGQGIVHGDIARSEAAFTASFSMAMPGLPKAIPRTVPMPRRPFSITPSCKGAGRLQNQQEAKQRKHGQLQGQGALPSYTIEPCLAVLPS